jgi:capsular exopolysaccharide synthesis family protein
MSRVDEILKLAGDVKPREGATSAAAVLAFDEFRAENGHRPQLDDVAQGPRLPLGGDVTRLSPAVDPRVVVDDKMTPAAVEQYRRVATSLLLHQRKLRTLMVSSALPRDGKTLTSANIATTLSQSYKQKVLLIDADIRRPSLHHLFGLPNSVGLADVLRPGASVRVPQVELSPFLTVLTAGRTDEATMAGLISERMRALLADATQQFDWIILDTPPVALVSDANILASLVDGVILVIGAGATPLAAVQHAISAFGHDRILGVVLNRAVTQRKRGHGYYGEYYRWHGDSPRQP